LLDLFQSDKTGCSFCLEKKDMRVVFLGTGTSHGIPMIGCHCAICRSSDPRNRRRRCSLYVEANETHLIFDTPPDFREQVLEAQIERVDAVFLTHPHADHIFGFDDIRRFSALQKTHIPVYGSAETMRQMRIKFDYVERKSHSFGGVPRVYFNEQTNPVEIGSLRVSPLPAWHGKEEVYGYRVDCSGKSLAYLPDCSAIPKETLDRMQELDLMILDGLRPQPHPTHLSISEAVEILGIIGARRSFITHLTHDSDHHTLQKKLAPKIEVPWDGLEVLI
jgi:phosphoribosyl 1,2-cyclic phosphate phosphodiesterase